MKITARDNEKSKYRFLAKGNKEYVSSFHIQVKKWFGWVTIKSFIDDDMEYAYREAMELLEVLEGRKDIKVRLI